MRLLLMLIAAALVTPAQAAPGERDQLNACKTIVAAQSQKAATGQADPALQKCRQIIKEWTLRDSRRSVDENGQPLK
jgi:hypothetical protein